MKVAGFPNAWLLRLVVKKPSWFLKIWTKLVFQFGGRVLESGDSGLSALAG
jgi:hypothetical protein